MIVRLSLLALCAALVVTPALAKDKSGPAAEPVACTGPFGPDSSEATLIETFGAQNVVTGQVYGPEGMELLATTVFPDDPQRTMRVGWWDEENRTQLSYVDLAPSQVGPGGVRVGMTVDEIRALNGEPFTIGGFWWDYGGYANIQSGNLADLPGGCYLSLRFGPTEDYSTDIDVTPVAGEVQIPSDEPLLKTLDVRVQVVSLSYASPDAEE